MKTLVAFLAGLIFSLGLIVSGMTNPAKVINFLDITGTWDPSLAFVMGGALVVTFVGFRIALRRPAPIFDDIFHLPQSRQITKELAIGSALFGIGWGLSGLCPGPAIAIAAMAPISFLPFGIGLIIGMLSFSIWKR